MSDKDSINIIKKIYQNYQTNARFNVHIVKKLLRRYDLNAIFTYSLLNFNTKFVEILLPILINLGFDISKIPDNEAALLSNGLLSLKKYEYLINHGININAVDNHGYSIILKYISELVGEDELNLDFLKQIISRDDTVLDIQNLSKILNNETKSLYYLDNAEKIVLVIDEYYKKFDENDIKVFEKLKQNLGIIPESFLHKQLEQYEPLLSSFFAGAGDKILYPNAKSTCEIINRALIYIYKLYDYKFQDESLDLYDKLKQTDRGILKAFKQYTLPKIFRYINGYLRSRQTIEDVNRQFGDNSSNSNVTQEEIQIYINAIQYYFTEYQNRCIVTSDNIYVLRSADIDKLGLQLNKSVLVQGFSSTTSELGVSERFLRGPTDVVMILHLLPGICYIPMDCISTIAEEAEILLENNLFYTLRGTIDCTMVKYKKLYAKPYMYVLVDVSTHMLEEFNIQSHYYEPTTSFCYRVPSNMFTNFENQLHGNGLNRLKISELREICKSLSLNCTKSEYDMIIAIQHTASKKLKKNCVPRELETLFCALMGTQNGCLKEDYNYENIIVTDSGEFGSSISKRRRLYE